ncbi:hypothetical protein LTS18_009675 [Coniosporium uncinatum]|uniref:Uncharacterized protein n=1 Tax=Coniosporium uncinatum TaxID=93489 RepID=A0ACC3D0L1_9PEZI|nr:hypothetical protein LTS18_009675 [Coniosporium uncinatum]
MFVERKWEGKEQDALLHLMTNHAAYRQHLGMVSQRYFNAYPVGGSEMGWKSGDLVVHFAGCWVQKKCQVQWEDFWSRRIIA